MDKPLRKKEYDILKALALGDKTIRELNWMLTQKWETTNYQTKQLINAGYVEKYVENNVKCYKLTENGKRKMGEYSLG